MFSISWDWTLKSWYASRLANDAVRMQSKTGLFFPVKISVTMLSAWGKTGLQQSVTAKDKWHLDSHYPNCWKCYPGNFNFLQKDAQSLYGTAGEIGFLFWGSLFKQLRQIPDDKRQFYSFFSLCWASILVVILVSLELFAARLTVKYKLQQTNHNNYSLSC